MKKQLAASLAAAFVLGIAGTSFAAAANPFVDVPAKHWSYDAVTKLSQAGIIDGYGDGTFRGDKTITRYEMAMIVAKAMGKSEKVTPEQKAMLDKLSTEFGPELENLGVRVAQLEKDKPNFKFSGDARVRYVQNIDLANRKDSGKTSEESFQNRIRLNIKAKVGDNIDANVRLAATNVSDDNGSSTGDESLAMASFTFKNVGFLDTVTVGRFNPAFNGNDWSQLAFSPGTTGNDGIGISFGNKLKVNYNYFDIERYRGSSTSTTKDAAINVSNLNLRYAFNDNLRADVAALYSHKNYYPYELYSAGLTYSKDKMTVNFEAVRNQNDEDINGNKLNDRNGWMACVQYGKLDHKVAHSWDTWVSYQSIGQNALDWDVTGPDGGTFGKNYGTKGWQIGANYMVAKDAQLYVVYDPEMKGYSNNDVKSKHSIQTGLWFYF